MITLRALKNENNYKTFLKKNLTSFIFFLGLPLIISVIHGLLTISCSIWDGLLFYIFVTFPSVIIGASIAVISIFISDRFRYLVFLLLFLAILSITFFELYYNPQIFFYNPVYAYYPGTIYDEAISVNLKLITYRSLNLIFFGTLYFISSYVFYKNTVITKRLIIYISVLISALFIYLSPDFGYSTTQNRLKHELSNLIRTEHFDIYFSPDINREKMKIITISHEYYYSQLARFYREVPKERYVSFIFKDNAQKKEYFGSENADVAKPWLREIFTVTDDYNITLRHEIAHCFAGEFGWSIFRVADNFNPALIEGAAVAGAFDYDLNDVHYLASLAYHNGYKINLNDLFTGLNFFGQTSGLSYIYAGSFCRFLIDKYGIGRFKRLYRDINFSKIYTKNLDDLSSEYFNFISGDYEALNQSEADYYFGRKPVIYKICPRFVADRLREAWQYFSEQNYPEALNLFTKVLRLTDNYPAVTGYAASLFNTGKKSQAIGFLKEKIPDFKNTAYYYNIQFSLADYCSRVRDSSYADSLYNDLISRNPSRTLNYLSNLRINLLNSDSLIIRYLEGSDIDKYLILRGLNKESYNYYSIPVLVDLAETLNESEEIFLEIFNKSIQVDNYPGSFAVYRLSVFLLAHLDYTRGRKMAALAMRYDTDKNFNFILSENYNKADWLYEHGNEILSSINIR